MPATFSEVRVVVKSVFNLKKRDDGEKPNTIARVALVEGSKMKEIDHYTTGVQHNTCDPEYEEDFIFAKIPSKYAGKLQIKIEIQDTTDNPKKPQTIASYWLRQLNRIQNQDMQRKLMDHKLEDPTSGLLFFEYTHIPDGDDESRVPVSHSVDGDDSGMFCGHVYCEIIDAIDLNGDHMIVMPDGANPETWEAPEYVWSSPQVEVFCSKQAANRMEPFMWKSMELESDQCNNCPSWNEGCTFPVDWTSNDSLKPIKDDHIGCTTIDCPYTPIMRMCIKRLQHKETYQINGYIVMRIGFIPFGVSVSELAMEVQMDEFATQDLLGMRRKYAETDLKVCRMNDGLRGRCEELQDRIDELEGLQNKKKADDAAKRAHQPVHTGKGPSQKAMWHFFALSAEPCQKIPTYTS